MRKKFKTRYSPELGKAKQDLYRFAYLRIQRAIKIGAHIEAIALIESLMSDRLESAISSLTGKQVKASTLGRLIKEFDGLAEIDSDLKVALYEWNASRAFVVHQMVKLTNDEISSWTERIAFARLTAKEGLVLLAELRRLTDKTIRNLKKTKI